MKLRIAIAAVASTLTIAGTANAAPVLNTANGHYYEYVAAASSTWEADQPLADAMTYNGLQGYLATSTSADEDAFIQSVISSAGGIVTWIDGTDAGHEGTFKFTGGPEAGQTLVYTNWVPGEPNNSGGAENYIELNYGGTTAWNDAGPSTYAGANGFDTRANGYVVEFSSIAAVPEPATWAMMIAGLGLVGLAMRRRLRQTTAPFACS